MLSGLHVYSLFLLLLRPNCAIFICSISSTRLKPSSCWGPWQSFDAIFHQDNIILAATMASPRSLGFSWRRSQSTASRDNDNTTLTTGPLSPQSARAGPQNIADPRALSSSLPPAHREPIRSFVSGGGARDSTGTCVIRLGTLMGEGWGNGTLMGQATLSYMKATWWTCYIGLHYPHMAKWSVPHLLNNI